MNRVVSTKSTSIAENCRSILRERYCNPANKLSTFPQQGCPPYTWKPCHSIPTNPIYSPYGVDNLRMSTVCCEEPSYYNTLFGLSPTLPSNNYVRHPNCIDRTTGPMQPIFNRQTNPIPYRSTPSENCIQMITNAIITKIRCKIPHEEVALLCCCLPSLIRQIMCKNPWLTPNDIIQWLSADIIKEAMHCFDQVDLNVNNEVYKPKQDQNNQERLAQQRKESKSDDSHSTESQEDDNESLSSYQSTTSASPDDSFVSQHSSRSVLDLPNNIQKEHSTKKKKKHGKKQRKKKNKDHSPSTRSFTSQQSKDRVSGSHHSLTPSSWSAENRSKQSDRNSPIHIEEDQKSFASHNKDSPLSINTFDSDEDYDQKSIDFSPKPPSVTQSSRIHLEYPGKKDPNARQDVEKCLAFYQKIREYFDDDVAAMLLKCCLCYGDCSGKK